MYCCRVLLKVTLAFFLKCHGPRILRALWDSGTAVALIYTSDLTRFDSLFRNSFKDTLKNPEWTRMGLIPDFSGGFEKDGEMQTWRVLADTRRIHLTPSKQQDNY